MAAETRWTTWSYLLSKHSWVFSNGENKGLRWTCCLWCRPHLENSCQESPPSPPLADRLRRPLLLDHRSQDSSSSGWRLRRSRCPLAGTWSSAGFPVDSLVKHHWPLRPWKLPENWGAVRHQEEKNWHLHQEVWWLSRVHETLAIPLTQRWSTR